MYAIIFFFFCIAGVSLCHGAHRPVRARLQEPTALHVGATFCLIAGRVMSTRASWKILFLTVLLSYSYCFK